MWVKRADVHNTQEGDVVFADDRGGACTRPSAGIRARGIARAVVQPHVEGDLVKFYGVGAAGRGDGTPPWFRWFYHTRSAVAGHRLRRRGARPRPCAAPRRRWDSKSMEETLS